MSVTPYKRTQYCEHINKLLEVSEVAKRDTMILPSSYTVLPADVQANQLALDSYLNILDASSKLKVLQKKVKEGIYQQ